MANRSLLRTSLALALVVVLSTSLTATFAQSGRNQEKPTPSQGTPGKPRPRPGPIADPSPSPPSISKSQVPRKDEAAKPPDDEVDELDTVRVSSNLVPIPASVVDAKGLAITGLKLEDFELRIDGQVKPISDLTRAETSVRLAMLFDNSGSLDLAREFEKRAAMHFFRMVMRPSDEAAIYSIETESYLAQPLTKNVGLLQETIASFGRPQGATSLFDAVIEASRYLRPYGGRRVLVIVSDGIETMRENDFELT